jgi:phosphopantothenoylcysteine decarboxylase/phosphopantothenate--cysteine ligase
MARILLGVSSGIAAYKSVDVMRELQRHGHEVRVVMTPNASRFVGVETFAALSGHTVGIDLFGHDDAPGFDHLDFARFAEIILICPASANTLAAIAHGDASNMLTTSVLASDVPVVVAPAMNPKMWHHPATQANLHLLTQRGVVIITPAEGTMADGDVGIGRLQDAATICAAVARVATTRHDLAGRTVVITGGGTREPIDAVRYIGNRSSGKMAWALAERARARGAAVTMIHANVDLPHDPSITYVSAPTADQLHMACLTHTADADIVIMAAAVADFRPAQSIAGKIDKSVSSTLDLTLEKTTDILSELGTRKRSGQFLIGFAAEAGPEGLVRARDKRVRKGCDALVFNDISTPDLGFGSDDNQITILTAHREEQFPRATKAVCADLILDCAVDGSSGGVR